MVHSLIRYVIESFRYFVALEELMVEHAAINCPESPRPYCPRLVDWLPPSIERVYFREVKGEQIVPFLNHLMIVASEAPTTLPKLRSVRFTPRFNYYYSEWRNNFNGPWLPLFNKVTAAFDQTGIAFVQVGPGPATQEPWLDRIHPDLADKARRFGYQSF